MQVRALFWEDPPEKGMATLSSILAWRIPGTEEAGGLQCVGSQRVGHDCSTHAVAGQRQAPLARPDHLTLPRGTAPQTTGDLSSDSPCSGRKAQASPSPSFHERVWVLMPHSGPQTPPRYLSRL